MKTYEPGDRVFVRRNKRLGNKFDKVFVEKVVERDLGTTVLINGKKFTKATSDKYQYMHMDETHRC